MQNFIKNIFMCMILYYADIQHEMLETKLQFDNCPCELDYDTDILSVILSWIHIDSVPQLSSDYVLILVLMLHD